MTRTLPISPWLLFGSNVCADELHPRPVHYRPRGQYVEFAPQFGDLTSTQGGFVTSLSKLQASWNITDGGRAYRAAWTVPKDTVGEAVLPQLPIGGWNLERAT